MFSHSSRKSSYSPWWLFHSPTGPSDRSLPSLRFTLLQAPPAALSSPSVSLSYRPLRPLSPLPPFHSPTGPSGRSLLSMCKLEFTGIRILNLWHTFTGSCRSESIHRRDEWVHLVDIWWHNVHFRNPPDVISYLRHLLEAMTYQHHDENKK